MSNSKDSGPSPVEQLIERQHARGRPGTYQEILDLDAKPVPKHLRDARPDTFGLEDLPIDVYVDPAYHELEKEHLWSRVWQFACREEHIPKVGDHYVYEIANRSYLIMRSAPDEIKAFPNACLHRGRLLKESNGRCSEIRCPFHGFAWELDGRLKDIPMHWDFPHVEAEEFHLPEVKVDTWRGFVFINPDPDAGPLGEYLGELDDHFATWYEHPRYLTAHVSKKLRCNWKIASEAFMECWHLQATHPQAVGYVGVPMCQIDIYENFARFTTPSEVLGPFAEDRTPEQMLRSTLDIRDDEPFELELLPGESARDYVARVTRESWRQTIGDNIDAWSDADLVDNLTYLVFPNFWPWGGVHRIVYRFRPDGDDHRSSVMEVMILAPDTGEHPAPATEVKLDFDEPWSQAGELGLLGSVLEQDAFNMQAVQRGLETTVKPGVTLAANEENELKWFRQRYAAALRGEL